MKLDKSQQAKHIQFEMRCMGEGFVKGEMVQWHIQSYGSEPRERVNQNLIWTDGNGDMVERLNIGIVTFVPLNGESLKEVLNWVFRQNMRMEYSQKYAFALWLLSRFEELHCCGTIGETPQAKPTKSRLRSKTQISASPNIYTRIYANVKYFWKQIYVYMYLPNNQPTKS